MAKLADALDLGSSASRHVGSSPSVRTSLRSYELRLAGQLLSWTDTKKIVRAKAARRSLISEADWRRRAGRPQLLSWTDTKKIVRAKEGWLSNRKTKFYKTLKNPRKFHQIFHALHIHPKILIISRPDLHRSNFKSKNQIKIS